MKGLLPNTLATALCDFFSNQLPCLRGMSPHTIQSYRDSVVLLLRFVAERCGRPVAALDLADIGAPEVLDFLSHLERERHNSASTRNVRLAALHAFYRYVAAHHPEQMERCQRILGIPFKRFLPRQVEYLEYDEIQALLRVVDRHSPRGRRDYALLALMFNTGARVQEILSLRAHDLHLMRPFQVRLLGKGRKERFCPLWPHTARILRDFCTERELNLESEAPLFVNHRGDPLSRFGVRYLLTKYVMCAKATMPSLAKKRLHPHSMRHSTAVHLLKAGVDLCTISHWLGHASVNTTNRYTAVDLDMKREAIARAKPLGELKRKAAPWRKPGVLEWLEAL